MGVCQVRVRNGLFDEGGRSTRELIRFKNRFLKVLKKRPFIIREYAQCVISYTNTKCIRELSRVESYLEMISQGETVFLKDLYGKSSDV